MSWSALIEKAPVQLIGLYQTKGREADATVVVLRSNDFYGTEPAVLTRARHKTIVLLFGHEPPHWWHPLPGWPLRRASF